MASGRRSTAFARVTIGALLASAPAAARAERPDALRSAAAEARGHGLVGLLLHVGVFDGFGGGLQLGTDAVGVRASVGWQPLVLVVQRPGGSTALTFESALLVSPDLYVRTAQVGARTHLGLQGGYRHSSFLGHGGAAGFYVMFGLGAIDVHVVGGVLFFPDGESHAREELNAPGATFGFPGPTVHVGATVGVAFFP